MKISVRNAKINDSEAITELSGQLGYNSNSNAIQNRLIEILKNNEHCVYVAVENEKIIAWIHGFYSLRVESDFFVEIGGLVVHVNYRNNGIGKMLIENVFKWSESKKCSRIRVRCNIIRTESHKFYENLGFKLNKEQKIFDIQLN